VGAGAGTESEVEAEVVLASEVGAEMGADREAEAGAEAVDGITKPAPNADAEDAAKAKGDIGGRNNGFEPGGGAEP
jgi:hypothetical protein